MKGTADSHALNISWVIVWALYQAKMYIPFNSNIRFVKDNIMDFID